MINKIIKMRGCDSLDFYFVSVNKKEEREIISELQPSHVLLSYHYFKNKSLKDFCNNVGYVPKIMLDSGAYSAWSKGKNISPIDYMNYINKNIEYIDKYIMLDVIGEPELTLKYYEIMKLKNFNPLPVFHYGDDERFLQFYIKEGNKYIALGNTVPVKDKKKVAEWINYLKGKYINIKFHLLGSASKKITQNTKIDSCDSSTWILMAFNGYPKEIKGKNYEATKERAKYQMRKIMEECN